MMEIFRQGHGNTQQPGYVRVDLASGRVIDRDNGPSHRQNGNKGLHAKHRRAITVICVAFLAAALLLLSACASTATQPADPSISIESVRITAAGHFIDLRYRVLDAERANASLGPGVKPLLIDEKTGVVMQVPMTAKLGALRQTRGVQRPNREYFVLFANTAGLSSGSTVTAEIGDMTFERLTIE